jgi:tetratricopeptide (TPR) repeat protein
MNQVRWLPAIVLAGAAMLLPDWLLAAPDATMDAIAPSEIATASSTDEADSLFTVAGQLYAQRRFREAIPLFVRVVEIDPRNGNAYALLGGSYFQLGIYADAIGAFERAIELDEGIKLAYIGLVSANYLTERAADAQQWLLRLIPLLNVEERDRYLATLSSQFPGLEVPGS